jgi:uncharacterized protein (DUF934 family)
MTTLIKQRRIVNDGWRVIGLPNEPISGPLPGAGDLIVPLAVWREQQAALLGRPGRTGVWLEGAEDPAVLFSSGSIPELIAVRFAAFTDGRGYSVGRLLRERHGFRGELRAIGDVLRDALFDLARCGFDAFALRDDQDPETALTAFEEFSEVYQAAADRGPLFVRRFQGEPAARSATRPAAVADVSAERPTP